MDDVVDTAGENQMHDLRLRVAHLRQELFQATEAYREALDQHDSKKTIPLLRSRSQLMRQLLETQCQLLLSLQGGSADMSAGSRPG